MKKYIFTTIVLFALGHSKIMAQADFSIAAKSIDSAYLRADSLAKISTPTNTNVPDTAVSFKGKVVYGVASFYSKNLENSKTSTGERFHHKLMTAASNNFKLNTWVRVTNLRNDKSVIVRINDHMAVRMYKKGRVVDLSHSAAAQLDFILLGVIKVKVEEVAEGTEE